MSDAQNENAPKRIGPPPDNEILTFKSWDVEKNVLPQATITKRKGPIVISGGGTIGAVEAIALLIEWLMQAEICKAAERELEKTSADYSCHPITQENWDEMTAADKRVLSAGKRRMDEIKKTLDEFAARAREERKK